MKSSARKMKLLSGNPTSSMDRLNPIQGSRLIVHLLPGLHGPPQKNSTLNELLLGDRSPRAIDVQPFSGLGPAISNRGINGN